jgi:hypothetical protein
MRKIKIGHTVYEAAYDAVPVSHFRVEPGGIADTWEYLTGGLPRHQDPSKGIICTCVRGENRNAVPPVRAVCEYAGPEALIEIAKERHDWLMSLSPGTREAIEKVLGWVTSQERK